MGKRSAWTAMTENMQLANMHVKRSSILLCIREMTTTKKILLNQEWWYVSVIPALERLKHEDSELGTGLIARPCLKKKKRKDLFHFFKKYMLNERSQSQKATYHVVSFTRNIQSRQIHENREQRKLPGARQSGQRRGHSRKMKML
jgi:hypothetical protein